MLQILESLEGARILDHTRRGDELGRGRNERREVPHEKLSTLRGMQPHALLGIEPIEVAQVLLDPELAIVLFLASEDLADALTIATRLQEGLLALFVRE